MKAIYLLGAVFISSLAQAGVPAYVPIEHKPVYIEPVVSVDATSAPWSFNMIKEPEILPIIPEVSYQIRVEQAVTITDYKLLSDVLFDFDKHTVDRKNTTFVSDIVSHIMDTYEKIDSITISGHTDYLGSDAYNSSLSMRRADTIKQLMGSYGVPSNLMTTQSFGESQPVTDGCPTIKDRGKLKECLKEDRRVEISVYGKAKVDDVGTIF